MVVNGAFIPKIDYVKKFMEIKILKGLQIKLLILKLQRFYSSGAFCLLEELHQEGSAGSLQSRLVLKVPSERLGPGPSFLG